jgi:type IV pilus assembly protein PilC
MKFNYQARTKQGGIHTGQVEASSKETAIALLQKNDLYVTFLEEAAPPLYAKRIQFFEKISKKDVVLFSRQLAIMFHSKVPLVESLKVLSSQTKNPNFQEKILKISEDVEAGTSFSKSLAQYPEIFSSFYVAMVRSGEVSGKLAEVLNYLADHVEREYHLEARTKGALIYPALILLVVILVLAMLTFFVIPHLSEVLEGTGMPLPPLTKLVIGLAAFAKNWSWLVLMGIILTTAALFRYYLTENGKRFFDKYSLKLPLIGGLLKMVFLTRFAENLSTLIAGGLPITQALETVADIIGSESYKKVIYEARDEVKRGKPISVVLGHSPDLFPPVFTQMVLVGERTGSLDTTLMSIVNFYRKEIDRRIDNVLSIIEPVLIVFLGIVVAGLMLSILMPLYRMVAF